MAEGPKLILTHFALYVVHIGISKKDLYLRTEGVVVSEQVLQDHVQLRLKKNCSKTVQEINQTDILCGTK